MVQPEGKLSPGDSDRGWPARVEPPNRRDDAKQQDSGEAFPRQCLGDARERRDPAVHANRIELPRRHLGRRRPGQRDPARWHDRPRREGQRAGTRRIDGDAAGRGVGLQSRHAGAALAGRAHSPLGGARGGERARPRDGWRGESLRHDWAKNAEAEPGGDRAHMEPRHFRCDAGGRGTGRDCRGAFRGGLQRRGIRGDAERDGNDFRRGWRAARAVLDPRRAANLRRGDRQRAAERLHHRLPPDDSARPCARRDRERAGADQLPAVAGV